MTDPHTAMDEAAHAWAGECHSAAAHLLGALDGYARPPLTPGTGPLPAEALGDA